MNPKFEQLGKYTLLEKIATGGMAEIYLARSLGLDGVNKFVAVKRILPHLLSDEEFIKMFKEEAKLAIHLNHNNVVSITDFGFEKNQYYLVMNYVQGKNLRQILEEMQKQNTYFSIEQILFIMKEVAAGLDYAHNCADPANGKTLNITHRDLSPQNVMISFDGAVKIIDFGIAKASSSNEVTEQGVLKGKFSYMSPEQAEGEPVDSRTDVFALGILLWELLAKTRLFQGKTEMEIIKKVKRCEIPDLRTLNPEVSTDLERIVLSALAKDREERCESAAELHRDLNRLLNIHYPDFSPREFSEFIKKICAEPFATSREKLITYAGLDLKEIAPASILSKLAETTSLPTEVYSSSSENPGAPDLPEGFHVGAPSEEKLEFSGIQSTVVKKAAPKAKPEAPLKPERPIHIPVKPPEKSGSFHGVLALLLIAFIGVISFKKYFSVPANTPAATELAVEKPASERKPASKQMAKKEVKVAFINISIENGSPDTKLLINGKPILETPPLIMYPVTAGHENTISAIDPVTQLKTEIKVTLQEKETRAVQLILKSQ